MIAEDSARVRDCINVISQLHLERFDQLYDWFSFDPSMQRWILHHHAYLGAFIRSYHP